MKKANWTIIMVMSAESNIFPDLVSTMEELYSVPSNETVNIIVIFDGIAACKFNSEFALPSVYYVKDGVHFMLDFPIWTPGKKDDLSNTKYLTEIITKIKNTYPAKKYGFMYLGHGQQGGSDISDSIFTERLVVLDSDIAESGDDEKIKAAIRKKLKIDGYTEEEIIEEATGFTEFNYRPLKANENVYIAIFTKDRKKGRYLTFKQLGMVLETVFEDQPLEFLLADCCWAQMIENAYSFRKIAKNFIASADEMPAASFGYNMFYRRLAGRPSTTGDEAANMLASIFFYNTFDDYEASDFNYMGVSITNLATKDIDEFTKRFEGLCQYMTKEIHRFAPIIFEARSRCLDYTYDPEPLGYAMFNIDLIWFLENLRFFNMRVPSPDSFVDKEITGLLLLLANIRVVFLGSNYEAVSPGQKTAATGGRGICITFPATKEEFKDSVIAANANIKSDFFDASGWGRFLTAYYRSFTPNEHIKMSSIKSKIFFENLRVFNGKSAGDDENLFYQLAETVSVKQKDPTSVSKWGPMKKLF